MLDEVQKDYPGIGVKIFDDTGKPLSDEIDYWYEGGDEKTDPTHITFYNL